VGKWTQRVVLPESVKFVVELIFYENTALGSAEVCSRMVVSHVVERFVDDSDPGSALDTDPNHACNMMDMPLNETFSAIERVDPDGHVFFVELFREI